MELACVRPLDILHLVRVDALARDLARRDTALGEDRDDLVPPLVLGQVDRLDDAARHRVHEEEEFGIRDIQGFRLGHETVQQRGVIRGLHLDLEAEVLARLARDVDDRRIEPPTWSRVTSLMFCAQIVGKPEIAPEPAARPALAAPFSTVPTLPLDFGIPAAPWSACWIVSHVSLPVLPRAARAFLVAWPPFHLPDAILAEQRGRPQGARSPLAIGPRRGHYHAVEEARSACARRR